MELYFLKPIIRTAIWGGNNLRDYYNFDDYRDDTGQLWCVSAQDENNACKVLNGEYKDRTLFDIWNEHPEYFNSKYNDFPYIIGLLGPTADLSIQIHPNDEYARKLGLKFGKNESWYFIEVGDNDGLVAGVNAANEEELRKYIDENRWNELIKRLKVNKGDFVNIKAGNLHALPKDYLTYEVQRGSDVTYRFYDYDRLDKDGNKRELHLERAIECLDYNASLESFEKIVEEYDGYTKTTLISNEDYTIFRLDIKSKAEIDVDRYMLLTCIDGEGLINDYKIRKGDSCLVPLGLNKIVLSGEMVIMGVNE